MNIFYALILILIGGVMSGSFTMTAKYIRLWKFENVWLQFAFWAFLIFPCVTIFTLIPQAFQIYAATPINLLIIIMAGGLFFGIGQLCFVLSINRIGVGLGFVINIGIGTGLGVLLPLIFQHPDKIMTRFGMITIIGVLLIIVGLIVSNYAGVLCNRDKYKSQDDDGKKGQHSIGVLLAIIAGFSSAGQNLIFSLTYDMQLLSSKMGSNDLGAANIVWPGFLMCCFIPYAGYTLYLHHKNKTWSNYHNFIVTKKNYIFTFIMSLCWYIPVILYGKSTQLLGGTLGPLICWPMCMVLIILTANFWGWQRKEWEGCNSLAKKTMQKGLIFLILAIVILAYGSSL